MKSNNKQQVNKHKNVKLEQEQFIIINENDKNKFKELFSKSKQEQQQQTPLCDILLNFLSSDNNNQQLIQMKKLESFIKSTDSTILKNEINTIKLLIEFIYFIQFKIGSKNISVNKSMSQIIFIILNFKINEFNELIFKFTNESINNNLLVIQESSTSVTTSSAVVFSISFLIDITNLEIENEEITIFKFINIMSNKLSNEINQFEQQNSTNSNSIILHDCENNLRSLVTLFTRFSNLIRKKLIENIPQPNSDDNDSNIVFKSMQSLSIQLERILSNLTLPRQLATNSGYLISEIIVLYGNDCESIQKQILSSITNNQDKSTTTTTTTTSILDILNNNNNNNNQESSFQNRFKSFPEINQISILRGLSLTGNIYSSLTNSIYNNENENIFLNIIFKGICEYCSGTVDQHSRFISLEYLHLCILKIKAWLNNSVESTTTTTTTPSTNNKIIDISNIFPSCKNGGYELFFNNFFLMALDIVWRNWETTVQNISTLSNNIFDELLTIHYKCCNNIILTTNSNEINEVCNNNNNNNKSSLFIYSITTKLIDEDWYQKNKYTLLKLLLERVGPTYMIQLRGNFLKNIFSSMCDHTICNSVKLFLDLFIEQLKINYLSTEQQVTPAATAIATTTATSSELNKIEKYWIYPLLEVLTESDTVTSSRIIVYALPSLLKVFPESLFKILNILMNDEAAAATAAAAAATTTTTSEENNRFKNINYNIRIRISLALLNSSRQLSLIEGRELQSKYHNIIVKSLENEDESLRLLGLELVCVSPKQTERTTIRELNLVKNFILLNLKGSSPFIRNQSLSTLYRFWIRLREGCCKVFRAETNPNINIEKDDPEIVKADSQDRYITIDDLVDYINWSCQLFSYNLYPDAPFARKMLPLEALSQFTDIWSIKGVSSSNNNSTAGNGTGTDKKSLLEFLKYIETKSTQFYSKESTDILINNLWDSYDKCRELSTDILMKFPSPLPGMESDEKIISFILWAVKLACSPKARECDTGAFALKLYLKKYVLSDNRSQSRVPIFNSNSNDETSSSSPVSLITIENKNKATLEYVSQILRILKSQSKLASKNLLEAAKFAPMHGLILSLRYIISELSFQELSKIPEEKKQWRELLAQIIDLMKSISSIVLRVVADLAPEGNNPNQLLVVANANKQDDGLPSSLPSGVIYDDDERLASNFSSSICMNDDDEAVGGDQDEDDEEEAGEEDEDDLTTTTNDSNKSDLKGGVGQIITVCSWQCTKQISLVLGTILDKVDMPSSEADEQVCMITTKQIEEIGHQFFTILLQSRHKGAIEKTYLGFQVLCATLMKSSNTKLSSLPSTWIKFLFERVKEQSLQITRRSAGLPFAFIGILTGESTMNQRVNHLLNHVMDNLLELASGGNQQQQQDSGDDSIDPSNIEKNIYLPQVHSINILKSIFRARAIIQELDQYLAVTLITVIKAFSSKSWSVRNSATMAFSVLVDRIIGTKKLKADSSIINTTTFYHFFSRMPAVYPFLLTFFKNSLQFIISEKTTSPPLVEEGKIIQSTLYAILVLFSRLQPSNIDHPNDLLAPAQFVPLISQCCQFSNYMVRQISARALVPLISTIELIPFIRDLISKLLIEKNNNNNNLYNSNKVHGILLQIYHLIKGHLPTINQKERELTIFTIFNEFIPQLSWIQNSENITPPPISFIYFSILNELEKNCQISLSSNGSGGEILNLIIEKSRIQLLSISKDESKTNLPMFYTWIESVLQFYLLFIKKQLLQQQANDNQKQQFKSDLMKLFNHQLYEIKITTMKFLLKNRFIVTELLDQQILQNTIINVILTDSNSTCRKKAFKLLSYLSLPISIETVENSNNSSSSSSNSNVNLYQLLCNTIWGLSNSMKKESIVLFGHYLKQFYQQKDLAVDSNNQVLNNWIKMVKELTKSHQPLELRQAISKAIEACSDVIFKNQQPTSSADCEILSLVSIESWFAISTLLEDEDDTIRSDNSILSSRILYQVSNPESIQVKESEFVVKQGPKCLELVYSYISSNYSLNNSNYILSRFIEILKLDKTTNTVFDDDFQNSKVLFDKEKDNYFEEQVVKIQFVNYEISKLVSSSSANVESLKLEIMKLLIKCTAWLKKTRESNQSGVLGHWLTFNPEIFTLFYTYLVSCNSVVTGGDNQDYSSFINTIKSNLLGTQLHPILSMVLNTLIIKLESTTTTTTPKNYYFLTSKQ